jgi:hypothetical protein
MDEQAGRILKKDQDMQRSLAMTIEHYKDAARVPRSVLGNVGSSIVQVESKQVKNLNRVNSTKPNSVVVGSDRVRFPRVNISGSSIQL